VKEFVRKNFPRTFAMLRTAVGRARIETQVIRQAGLGVLVDRLFPKKSNWEKELPVQSVQQIKIEHAPYGAFQAITTELRERGLEYSEGGHTIYLAPKTLKGSAFAAVAGFYPPDAGLKIVKNRGRAREVQYAHGSNHSQIHLKILYSHAHLTLVANFLHLNGLGPRLYDLVELSVGDETWTAYVIEHCDGRIPTEAEWSEGINRLKAMEAAGQLKLIAPTGFNHVDFAPPGCNGNCFVDRKSGKFSYIDFQNFLLPKYEMFLENIALEAANATHFGDTSILRGGRYLYQSVPGLGLPAKRDVQARAAVIEQMIRDAGFSVKDRVVLDIGCNIGMMLGQYLRFGARWCHGWDFEKVTPHTRRILMAIGCTRFSLTSGPITHEQPVEADVPDFVRAGLDGCVISYLAIRGHIGWVAALGRVPWEFMVYEGHEYESAADFEKFVSELQPLVPIRVARQQMYVDGVSKPRLVAIIARQK
jgi:hypothetical protein